jgi:parallel beta-helix repeat protein
MHLAKKLITTALFLTAFTTISFAVESIQTKDVVKASGGECHTLILMEDKSVWACGDNQFYQLGIGDTQTDQYMLIRVHDGQMPTSSDYLENINDISAGWKHSLALDANNFVWAWGQNVDGELGVGDKVRRYTPVKVKSGQQDPNDPNSFLQDIIAVAAGRSGTHSLALDDSNNVWTWGNNDEGQLGIGSNQNDQTTPVQVLGPNAVGFLQDIIAISAGANHSLALDDSNNVWTWGHNNEGQLGIDSDDPCSLTPVKVLSGQQDPNNSNSYLKNIVAISAGWDHSMALEKLDFFDANCNGRVYTWGNNGIGGDDYYSFGGRLGDGTTADRSTPVVVLAGDMPTTSGCLENIIAVSAGEGHCMALDIFGNVWTWGDNYYGQLGIGTEDPCSLTPVKVVGPGGIGYLNNIVSISAGYWHCIAIDSNGTIWTWGLGEEGQLGRGNQNFTTPQRIPTVYNITQQTFNFRIQGAVNDANSYDVIEASPATYYENVIFGDTTADNITLKSSNPNNLNVISETVIDGLSSDNAVKFTDNTGSVLTGFTIRNGADGIYCYSSSPQIINCIVKDNTDSGIYCNGSAAVIKNNWVSNNDKGIYCSGASAAEIKDNWIFDNDSGVYLHFPASEVIIRNNTITKNTYYGIYRYLGTAAPNIANCIIWNNADADDLYNCTATYSCISDCNDANGTENICGDANNPSFIDDVNNNYHLGPNSPCIDAGNTALITDANETDIDGQPRILDGNEPNKFDPNNPGLVDIGADEWYDFFVDFHSDGIVNFRDFAVLAETWWLTPSDSNYNADCNLAGPNSIDGHDLRFFCDYWLWKADWFSVEQLLMMRAGSTNYMTTTLDSASATAIYTPTSDQLLKFQQTLLDIVETIKWLEYIWLNDPVLSETTDEKQWLQFIEAVEASFKDFLP